MAMDSEIGIWKQAASWLWGLLVPMMLAIWGLLNSKISDIKLQAEAALPRKEWESARIEAREERERLRDDVKELFNRGEAVKDLINQRVDGVRESVERKIEDLRRDVNGGFNTLRDEIRQLRQ